MVDYLGSFVLADLEMVFSEEWAMSIFWGRAFQRDSKVSMRVLSKNMICLFRKLLGLSVTGGERQGGFWNW